MSADVLVIAFGGLGVAILGGLFETARLLRRQLRRAEDVQRAVLGEAARQGVDAVPSMRQQFAQIREQMGELARRPAMNGGFDRLTENVQRVHDGLEGVSRMAGDAAAAAARADQRAREASDRLREMHAENRDRLAHIEAELAARREKDRVDKLREEAYIASLHELGIQIQIPPEVP